MKRVIVPACCHLRCERGAGWRVAFAALLASALVVSLARGQPPIADAFLPSPPGETATTATAMSLAELEQLALANNPTLAMASANVRAARGRQIQSGLRPNPTIGYMAQDVGEEDTAGQHGGFVSQEFVTGHKLQLNRAMGGREVEERQLLLDAQQLRVLNDVRLRFYDALAARLRVELSNQIAALGERAADESERLFNAAQISENDLLQSQIEAQESQILAANARNQESEARRRLSAVVGVDALGISSLAGNLEDAIPSYSWEESFALVISQNPRLAAAQARVAQARIALERARRENVPNVEVMASVSHMDQTGDDVAGVQIGIPLPICNRNQGNILAADAELIAAENDRRRIELALQDELAMAYRRYVDAQQQMTRYRDEIRPRAQKSWDFVEQGFREQQVGSLALLTSQRTFVRVNLAYVEALAELRRAVTLIEGMLLSESLREE